MRAGAGRGRRRGGRAGRRSACCPADVARRRPAGRAASPTTATSSSSSASTSSRWRRPRLAVPDGEHVLVARAGAQRPQHGAGAGWRRRGATPTRTAPVRVVAPMRRSPLASWPDVVDLAARARRRSSGVRPAGRACSSSTTPSGSTTRAARSPRWPPSDGHGLLVLAAGRPDALRARTGTGRRSSGAAGPACCCRRAPTSTATCSASCCRATRRSRRARAGVARRRRTAGARPGRPRAPATSPDGSAIVSRR